MSQDHWKRFPKLLFCLSLALFTGQAQTSVGQSFEEYSPEGAKFSMKVPGKVLPPQGSIFNTELGTSVYNLVEPGSGIKVFNFETKQNEERVFLASILQIRVKGNSLPKNVSDQQVKILNTFIGDEIISSSIARWTLRDKKISQWFYHYPRQSSSRNAGDADGTVYVLRSNKYLIVVVVALDYAKGDDPTVQPMLNSINIKD